MNLVINNAVNIERTIPSASVAANPLILPVPFMLRTAAAMRVVIFPSMIADKALLYPSLTAVRVFFPAPISSFIRVNIITFAVREINGLAGNAGKNQLGIGET